VNGKLSGRKLIPPPIKDVAGNFIRDSVLQANIFNKYFASVFTHDDNNTLHFTQHVNPTAGCCDASFTPLKVLKVLKGLKPKKLVQAQWFLKCIA